MTSILLIDDDPLITQPLERQLIESGYHVWVAHDGRTGLQLALEKDPDVVILDILMPEMDGWQVCRALRAQSVVPILMLTALGEEVDRILGLELGADDYLTKPFSTRELIARIRAMLRRIQFERGENKTRSLKIGQIDLNFDTRRVFKGHQELTLRHKEFELLSLLMTNAGQVVTRPVLFDEVWGTDWLGDMRTLDVHIRWLRQKIEKKGAKPRYIQTVRGVGYRFVSPTELN